MSSLLYRLNQATRVRRPSGVSHDVVRRTDQIDVAEATRYALARLCQELAPHLVFHSVAHTRDDVVPAVERLAALEGIRGEALLLLRTAAYYHDIGYVVQPTNHEVSSAQIAADILPPFGYRRAQIEVITDIILATKLPQSPRNHVEAVMADADLATLGQRVFFSRNQALRTELAATGTSFTDTAWYQSQLEFLRSHRYFTAAARALYGARKQQHTQDLERLLAHSSI